MNRQWRLRMCRMIGMLCTIRACYQLYKVGFWLPNLSKALCEIYASLGEFGVYDVALESRGEKNVSCALSTAKEPVDIYMRKL